MSNLMLKKAKSYAKQVNHLLEFIELSATTGEGMDIWFDWLKSKVKNTLVA